MIESSRDLNSGPTSSRDLNSGPTSSRDLCSGPSQTIPRNGHGFFVPSMPSTKRGVPFVRWKLETSTELVLYVLVLVLEYCTTGSTCTVL